MPSKKKTATDQYLEEVRQPAKARATQPDTDQQDRLIRDLVSIIRANLPGREYVVLSQAERYLKSKEPQE